MPAFDMIPFLPLMQTVQINQRFDRENMCSLSPRNLSRLQGSKHRLPVGYNWNIIRKSVERADDQ